MLQDWKKEDPPPKRVKPIPIAVIRRLCEIAQALPPDSHHLRAIAYMIIIASFYLLRPGEYTDSKLDTTPFTLGNVQIFIGPRRLDLTSAYAPDEELLRATSASLVHHSEEWRPWGSLMLLHPCHCTACSGSEPPGTWSSSIHSSGPGLHHRWPSPSLCHCHCHTC